jgi:Tfp pilus assembly protein PilV
MILQKPSHISDTRGISIVELIVGMTLLAVVVMSLAASGMYASRSMTRSRLELEATEYMQTRLEQLLAQPYDSLSSGSTTTAKGRATWTVTESGANKEILLVTNYAPTDGISVWDTVFTYRLNR